MTQFSLQPFLMMISTIILITTTTPTLSAAASFNPGQKEELATAVCRKTTDFAFCRSVVYSDPHAPTADRYFLNYIVIKKAFQNATGTRDYIGRILKSGGGVRAGLIKCAGLYDQALNAINEYFGDPDSETFDQLVTIAIEFGRKPRACDAIFRGGSPISKRNRDLSKISNICLIADKIYS